MAAPEEKDLEEAVRIDAIMTECDTTSDSSDEAGGFMDEKEFMKQAQDAAKNSEDDQTKVDSVDLVGVSNTLILVSPAGWCCLGGSC